MEYPPSINKFLVLEVPLEKVKNVFVHYRTFDKKSVEIFRMTEKPGKILVNQKPIPEQALAGQEDWSWDSMEKGGILIIRHLKGNQIVVMGN